MKKFFLMAVWVMLAMPLFAQTWSKDLEKTAKKGDVEAQFIVGAAYLGGDGVKANTKKAVQWLFMAAEAGNTKAIDKLCTFYSKELEQIATAGNVNAQFALANFYAEGNGVAQNDQTALNWYGEAAVQGHQEAKAKVLSQYSQGLEKLAAAGDADAQFALANFYAEGNGVVQNSETALSFYGDAAAQGHQEAKTKVLGSYNPGIVKLAKAGNLDAATQVADFLFNGKGGATKNEADAATYYSIAYKAGNKSAGTKLVTMYKAYLSGQGVPKNENLGNLYLAKAAAAGIEEAKEKFYSTDTPYLVETAKSGDFEALKALAVLRGGSWFLRAIDECKDVNQLVQIYQIYDKDKMSVQWPYKDTQDKVIMHGIDAVIYRAFALDDYLGLVNQLGGSTYYNFNNRNFDFNTIKIDSPNTAYFLIWNEWGSVQQRHILVKRLMNEFNHELAKIAYDEEYFQYDYDSYEILKYKENYDDIIVKGFIGLDNVVMNGNEKCESEVPSADELKMLVDSLPEFAVNPDAVRVIRNLKMRNGYLSCDIFYLPGLMAYGPKSFYRYEKYNDPTPYDITFDGFYLGAPNKTGRKVFTKCHENQPIYLDSSTLIGNADVTEYLFIDYSLGVSDYNRPYNANYVFSLFSTTIDGQIIPLKNNGSNALDYKIEGKDNAVMRVVRKLSYDKEGENGGVYGVPKILEVKDGAVSIVDNPNKPMYGTRFEDVGGSDYYVLKHPFTMPDGTTQEFDIPVSYYNNFIEFSYTKPDGTLKRYLLYSMEGLSVAKLKEELSPEYIETLIKECYESYCVDNSTALYYGLTHDEYEAKKEAELIAKEEAFWADMAKQYGKDQANLLRNSNQSVVKGLHINLLIDYTIHMKEVWNNSIGAVVLYRTDADGNATYIFYRPTGAEIRIRTKNYKIYDWTLYTN